MISRDRYVFYKDRPEWADVVPVPQDEGERNVVRIAYSPQFVDAHDYMRAVLLKDERSERALEITSTVLLLNPANFTVWEYRRRILTSLQVDLADELKFTGELIDEHSKNYQLWHHRQWIVTQLSDQFNNSKQPQQEQSGSPPLTLGQSELDFTAIIIADDSKNYHAWQYRRWVVNYFKIPPSVELQYTELLIKEDMYNNSAWNHRFVTVTKDEGLTPPVLKREVAFVQASIRQAPKNESSWNYLYGLLVPSPCIVTLDSSSGKKASPRRDIAHCDTTTHVVDETTNRNSPTPKNDSKPVMTLQTRPPSAANLRGMRKFAEDLAATDAVAADSVALLGFLVEVYSDCIQTMLAEKKRGQNTHTGTEKPSINSTETASKQTGDCDSELSLSSLTDLAVSTCERLATELDRIRANYWRYRLRQIQAMVA